MCLDAFVPENGESLSATASQPVKDAVAAALIALPQSRPSSFTRGENGQSGAAKGLADPLMHLWRIHVVRESRLVLKRFSEDQ